MTAYESARDPRYLRQFFQLDCAAPPALVRPGDQGRFVRRPRRGLRAGENTRFEAAGGRWGAGESNFPQLWKRGHRCVILADALFRRGARDKAVLRVARADGQPLALAGLWNGWHTPDGACIESFALLTLPSSEHPGEPQPVVLREGWLDDWLYCPVEEAAAYLRPYDPGKLVYAETRDMAV